MVQFHYAHEIRKFEDQRIPFNIHMYVPEHHPDTNEIFFEREDEAHLIKVRIFRRMYTELMTYSYIAYRKPY